MQMWSSPQRSALENAENVSEEAERDDHHEDAEAYSYRALGQPVPGTDPEWGADHGPYYEGWQAEELLRVAEAGRHVTRGPHDAGKHHDGEARRDGPLRGKAHAKHHQRDHHH